jgi:hypothetical protein
MRMNSLIAGMRIIPSCRVVRRCIYLLVMGDNTVYCTIVRGLVQVQLVGGTFASPHMACVPRWSHLFCPALLETGEMDRAMSRRPPGSEYSRRSCCIASIEETCYNHCMGSCR